MAGMTKDQREYALKRIAFAYVAAEARIKAKHTTPEVKLSDEEKTRLILSGEAVLNLSKVQEHGARYCTSLGWFFNYPTQPRPASVNETAVARDLAPIKVERVRLEDQLMLGDAATALEMIQGFETMIAVEEEEG
jgi:hypothetical protein